MDDLEVSGVLFLFPMILLAILSWGMPVQARTVMDVKQIRTGMWYFEGFSSAEGYLSSELID